MNVRRFEEGEGLTRGVAESVVRLIEIGARTIALSGGSTPRPVYSLLGSEMRPLIEEYEVTWVVVDERFVPASDERSNLRMLRETLFVDGVAPRHKLIAFDTTLETPAQSAIKFAAELVAAGAERLDCAILGIGDDGHTASLFPGTDVLEVSDRKAAAVWVPKLDMWRLTLTLPMLQHAARRWVLVAGGGKHEVLQRIAGGEDLPINRATSGGGETWYFVDSAAWPEV